MVDEKVIEFLEHSNRIEREYGEEALADALLAWKWAYEYKEIMRYQQFNNSYIKEIHRRLLRNLNPELAGNIRNTAIRIGGDIRNQNKKQIISELKKLYSEIPKTEKEINRWHIDFEKIHPFEDGNGRTGRILMNIQRLNAGLPILVIHEGKEQMEYYGWFR